MSKWAGALVLALSVFALAPPGSTATDRSISFYNLHTNERLTVVYKRDGRYIPAAMTQINHILRDWRRNEAIEMDPRLIDLAWEVYQRTGATEPINIICGYRAPETNAMLRANSNGVAQNSQHMYGNALDFFIPGVNLTTLRNVSLQMQVGGVGFYPTSGSPFVHIDVGSVRHWPGISRQQLAQIFPDGRTLHVPSDGQALPGYAEAQRAYDARGTEVVALFGQPSDGPGTTRLAGLFGRDNTPAATAAPAPTVVAAVAAPTIIQEPPLPRPNRDPIPGVTVTAAAEPAHEEAVAVMAYAPAAGVTTDALAILNAPPARPQIAVASPPAPAAAAPAPAAAPAAAPAPVAPVLVAMAAWDNPIGRVTAPVLFGTSLPFYSGAVTSRQSAFVALTAPSTRNSAELFAPPTHVFAMAFDDTPSRMRADRFSGPLVRQVAVLELNRHTTLASAR